MKTIRDIAVAVEERLHNDGLRWAMPTARLYSVLNGANGLRVNYASEHGDIYELMERDDSALTAMTSDYIALVTCGWAAPIINDDDDDFRPSLHPERRRVRLVITADRNSVVSVLRFEDEADDPVVDEGTATGSLADALRDLMVRAHGE